MTLVGRLSAVVMSVRVPFGATRVSRPGPPKNVGEEACSSTYVDPSGPKVKSMTVLNPP